MIKYTLSLPTGPGTESKLGKTTPGLCLYKLTTERIRVGWKHCEKKDLNKKVLIYSSQNGWTVMLKVQLTSAISGKFRNKSF